MARAEVLAAGLVVGESPRWHDGRLWLANWGAAEVVSIGLDGEREVMARLETTIPFSIDWLPDGRLLIVSGPERVLLSQEPDGSLTTYADLSGLSDHGFNELVVDGRGNAYVNGAGFDLMAGEEPAPGIVAVVTPDGSVREVADGIGFPNGMAVTPDNSTLIVADSYGRELTGFDIGPDGGLPGRRVWADLGDGVPDGICLDTEGAVWYADVPNRRCVRVREGGEVLDTIEVDRGCFACALGGTDRTTLFICAAEWRGPERMFDGPPSGQVLTAKAPAP
ncbi:MAG: SMP-30/gluconolactonase/LRE family protein, partial [Solirubrobacterales bacterium]